jgi:hypothetical protein
LYVVDSNLSYNKINPYVHIGVSYQARIRTDRWLQSRLTLQISNRTSKLFTARGWLGPGASDLGGPYDYADFVRVLVPYGAQLIDQSGWYNPWTPGPAYGKMEFCGYIIVRRGETRTITLEYIIPPNVFTGSEGRRYQLFVQHQPGNLPDVLRVTVLHDGNQSSTFAVARPAKDLSYVVGIQRRAFHPIPLPADPPTIVAPGHWIEPHTYLAQPKG